MSTLSAIEKTDQRIDFKAGTKKAGPRRFCVDPAKYWPWVFFRPAEIVCRHCSECLISTDLMNALEGLRGQLGRPLVITSGYRCAVHNKNVGGAEQSLHVDGMAVDVVAKNWREKTEILHLAWINGFSGGVGVYPNWLHLDLGSRRYWKA